MRKFGKYLRELSVVVIGVTITLIATNWINSRGERNDLKLYMDAVKLELEENLSLLENRIVYFGRSNEHMKYLASDKLENLSLATLDSYKDVTRNYFILTYKTSALEMLKSSGSMRMIKDKKLLRDIWECYANIEQAKQECNYYMLQKANETQEAIYRSSVTPMDIRKPEQKRLYTFYFMGVDLSLKQQFEACAENIRQTLTRF